MFFFSACKIKIDGFCLKKIPFFQCYRCWFGRIIDSIRKSFILSGLFIGNVWPMFGLLVSIGTSTAGRFIWNGAHQFKLRSHPYVPVCRSYQRTTISWIPKRFNWRLRSVFLLHGSVHGTWQCTINRVNVPRIERRNVVQFRRK